MEIEISGLQKDIIRVIKILAENDRDAKTIVTCLNPNFERNLNEEILTNDVLDELIDLKSKKIVKSRKKKIFTFLKNEKESIKTYKIWNLI